MIKLITGTGGTGKSLYVIKNLLANHKQYKKLFINIEGFKEDLFRRATGNLDLEIYTFNPHTYAKDFLMLLMDIKDEAEDLNEEDRVKTLVIYDEASFALRDYSTRDDLSCEISNFVALHRHYGPCDMIWMTQGQGKIHLKFKEDVEFYYDAVPFAKRMDPENDIVFDEKDPDDPKKVLVGGLNRIKFKKLEEFEDSFGQKYKYFDFYVSGDGGRANKRINGWKKYLYFIGIGILIFIGFTYYTFSMLFSSISTEDIKTTELTPIAKTVQNSPPYPVKNIDNNSSFSSSELEKPDIFDKYNIKYKKISNQRLFKFFYHDKFFYVGEVVLSAKDFLFFTKDNAIRLMTKQPITKDSYYISAMVDMSVANALGLIKDFDFNKNSSNNKKMTLKNE